MHNWNQLQPAPYDGMYQFPSVTGMNPTTGKPTGHELHICAPTNPDATDPYRYGTPMLPAGKYVVEVVVPPGYELVKEEDKNILIGDNFIAPVTQQFGGLGNIFIIPDQAAVGSAYNANNAQNPTQNLGRFQPTSHEGDTGTVETFWPCVGAGAHRSRLHQPVPAVQGSSAVRRSYPQSLRPQGSHARRPDVGAGEVLHLHLDPRRRPLHRRDHGRLHFGIRSVLAAVRREIRAANLPVSIKDWTGNEISRVYADQWGAYNGLTYSTWEVNPPNPTGIRPP
jgi:hypothetical protein